MGTLMSNIRSLSAAALTAASLASTGAMACDFRADGAALDTAHVVGAPLYDMDGATGLVITDVAVDQRGAFSGVMVATPAQDRLHFIDAQDLVIDASIEDDPMVATRIERMDLPAILRAASTYSGHASAHSCRANDGASSIATS